MPVHVASNPTIVGFASKHDNLVPEQRPLWQANVEGKRPALALRPKQLGIRAAGLDRAPAPLRNVVDQHCIIVAPIVDPAESVDIFQVNDTPHANREEGCASYGLFGLESAVMLQVPSRIRIGRAG